MLDIYLTNQACVKVKIMPDHNYANVIQKLLVNSIAFTNELDKSLGSIHGIGFSEYMVLSNLTKSPNQMMRRVDIADELGRTASGITRLLIPMEKIGLVEKASSERDARVSLVKITKAGKQVVNDAATTVNERSKKLLSNLDESKVSTLLALMNSIRGN